MKSQKLFLAGLALAGLVGALSACAGAAPTPTEDITAEPPHEATAVTDGPDTPSNSDTPAPTQKPGMPAGDVEIGTAIVDSVDILILESFPVQINVGIAGNLPDGCTQIGEITQSYDEATSTFTLKVSTSRPKDMACTGALVPYKQGISLDGVVGLKKGVYTVDVNGTTATFELQADNGPLGAP